MRHPKRQAIIDARITAEYVICGVCLTKNRVVSHQKTVRPVCGRCGYPLPDPFGARPPIRSLGEWMTRYRRALAGVTGLVLVGLLAWLVGGKRERSTSISGSRTQPTDAARVYAVSVVLRPLAPAGTDDEQDDLPPGSLPSRMESQSDGLYGRGTPTAETWTRSASVVLIMDVCADRASDRFQDGGGHDGALPGVLVLSHLQQMNGDPLDSAAGPHVVEQIHIDTAARPE